MRTFHHFMPTGATEKSLHSCVCNFVLNMFVIMRLHCSREIIGIMDFRLSTVHFERSQHDNRAPCCHAPAYTGTFKTADCGPNFRALSYFQTSAKLYLPIAQRRHNRILLSRIDLLAFQKLPQYALN